jgi:hypothetical protein
VKKISERFLSILLASQEFSSKNETASVHFSNAKDAPNAVINRKQVRGPVAVVTL